MTPTERAQYLIKELGHVKAEEHALWVANGAEKAVTRQYWYEVVDAIKKSKSCQSQVSQQGGPM